jgi:hypothetical protein
MHFVMLQKKLQHKKLNQRWSQFSLVCMVTFELKFTRIDKIEIAMSVQWDNYGIGGTIIFNLFVFFSILFVGGCTIYYQQK